MGLHYSDALIDRLLEGVQAMQESTTYQKVLRKGRQEGRQQGRLIELQRLLLRRASKRFGEDDAATTAALQAIEDIDRLEALFDRLDEHELQNWDELLR
jgi:hypothetical protein